ncbi:prephenate dehydratase [Corynebacterium suranareeae]|uniref:Prephenate dehydratase n=1 Tax=Corynebacterium suranareeae TaxID=2506452 RepID=A0A169S7Y2_9CORY|nr:prephenate dehydratase [Corynebacterium suranareeae]BAU97260.1 prephenate dehydratase [Corynebacterium suranareeae]
MSDAPTVVAYLGPAGTFTEEALYKFADAGVFGDGEIEQLPAKSPQEAVDAVRSGVAQFAVVAIENFVDGPVTPTFDALDQGSNVQIIAEEELDIAFSIMARPGTTLADVKTLATHPVGYQQVKNWMATNIPEATYLSASSNGAGAQMVAEGTADAAAAPSRAAQLFGLERLVDDVADVRGARTRFVAVRAQTAVAEPTGHDRTSVIFSLPNVPGSLVRALNEFANRGVDLTRIESRPTRKVFGTYRFHLDIAGHIRDIPVAEALRALYLHAEELVFVGSWPSNRAEDSTPQTDQLAKLQKADEWVRAASEGRKLN